jgi:hypothetical protein
VVEVTVRMSVAPAGTFTDVTEPSAEQLLVTVLGLVAGFVVGGAVGATVGGTVVLTGFEVVGVGAVVPGNVVDPGFSVVPTPAGAAVVATAVPVVAVVDEVTESPVTSVAGGVDSNGPLVVTADTVGDVPSSCDATPPAPESPHDETASAARTTTAAHRPMNERDGFMVFLRSR